MYSIYWEFIRFYFSSKDAHGLHSPFVFDFYHKVMLPKLPGEVRLKYENVYKQLRTRKDEIEVFDFGAGSKKRNEKTRKVSDIAKYSSKNLRCYRILYNYLQAYKPATVLELGTSFGLGTTIIQMANPESKIITIEGCKNTLAVAQEHLSGNVETINGNIDALIMDVLSKSPKIDFVFIDANHTYLATIQYFKSILSKAHEGTCIVFDDIYWSSEMKKAWVEIKTNVEVGVTIDVFEMGFVFLKKDQTKQNFKLR